MEYYSAPRKEENPPFATTRVSLENMMLNEMSQLQKYKYCIILFLWGI